MARADDPGARAPAPALKDKIVIIGGLFPDLDQHLTPMTVAHERADAGGRRARPHRWRSLSTAAASASWKSIPSCCSWASRSWPASAFLIGWRYRLKRQGMLLSSLATVVILAIDTFVFWQSRIILPIVLALLAWFMGELSGHYLGRWLGLRIASRWFVK